MTTIFSPTTYLAGGTCGTAFSSKTFSATAPASGSTRNETDLLTLSETANEAPVPLDRQYAGQTFEYESNNGLYKTQVIYPDEPETYTNADGTTGSYLVPLLNFVPTKDTSAAQSWALGIDFSQDHLSSYYPGQAANGFAQLLPMNRSKLFQQADKLMLQNRIDDGEKKLNEKISNILKNNGIELGPDEQLNFSVDQDGKITVGDGLDAEKKDAVERALNSDSSLGNELLLSEAQRRFADSGEFMSDGVTRNIVIKAYEQESGDSGYSYTKTNEGGPLTYSFGFTYQNGALLRDDGLSDDRIFNNRPDVFGGLSVLVGLDDEPTDTASFIDALSAKINEETDSLTAELSGLMAQAGMGDVMKKVTFAEAKDGSIVVEGNLRADQRRKLERLINGDGNLAERIKDQKARMEILREMEGSQQDGYDLSALRKGGNLEETLKEQQNKLEANPYGAFDNYKLDSESLSSARQQLLKSYLGRNGVSLDDVSTGADGKLALRDAQGNRKDGDSLQNLLNEFQGLEGELKALLKEKSNKIASAVNDNSNVNAIEVGSSSAPKQETRALLSMKRGVLSEATDEKPTDFSTWAQEIRSMFTKVGETEEQDGIVTKYNKNVGKLDPDEEIIDFTVKIDHKGRMSLVDVKTRGGDEEANRRAEKAINSMLKSEARDLWTVADFAEQLLEFHDDEHGDVREFKHQVYIDGKSEGGYRIESPDADKAAMEEMKTLGGEIGAALNAYFKSFNFSEPFNIHWSADQGLSVDNLFAAGKEGAQIVQMLNQLNERLLSDDPMNDDKFGNALTVEQRGLIDKFLELGDVTDKFHDPAMKKSAMSFVVSGKE